MLKEQHLNISIAAPHRVCLFSELTQSQPLSTHYELCDRCPTTSPTNFKASLESITLLQHLSESCRDWKGGRGREWKRHEHHTFPKLSSHNDNLSEVNSVQDN